MFNLPNKINRRIILPVVTATLTTLFGLMAMPSSAVEEVGYLSPVINLLLNSEHENVEFGSVIPGKLYSAAELAFWRNRAQNGPHVSTGDAYGTSTTGSFPDYGIIQGSANKLDSTDDEDIVLIGKTKSYIESLEIVATNEDVTDWTTQISQENYDKLVFADDCVALEPTVGLHTFHAWYEFGRFDLARDAAFVDLINGTSTHSSRIKSLLLAQVNAPCMDFNNRNIFRNGVVNNNAFWYTLEWLHRVLKTYDFLDESIFTAAEKAIIDDWFKGAAEWAYYYVSTYFIEPVYEVRATDPINSVIDLPHPSNPNNTGFWLNRQAYAGIRIRYEGSSVFWPAGLMINNRHLGQLNFVVHAGVKFGVDAWKKEGAQIVKEYVSFHFDDQGYFAEVNRAADPSSQSSMDLGIPVKAEHGLSYGANSLINIAEIAHILYLDGYENLFNYRSKARINESSGEIETGTVEKSLEWVLLKFRDNFMLDSAPAIYPLGLSNAQKTSDTVIHFCNNTHRQKVGGGRVVGRMYNPAAIINRYYKNPQIKEIYNFNDDFGNMCGYADSQLEIRPGPHGIAPGMLFQYSDAHEKY